MYIVCCVCMYVSHTAMIMCDNEHPPSLHRSGGGVAHIYVVCMYATFRLFAGGPDHLSSICGLETAHNETS